jgi:hypothetical protein
MSPYTRPAPRGFRWTDTPVARAVLVILIVLSLGLSVFASIKQVGLTNCLQERSSADAARTRALGEATDRERKAERDLLALTDREPAAVAALRQAALDAYAHTDEVRRQYPANGAASKLCG